MKIKTITCHDVYNAGASLQAYALVTYLNSLGHRAEIIDYKPDYLSLHHSLSVIGNPRYNRPLLREAYLLAKLLGRLKAKCGPRKRRYDQFRREYLPLTRRYNSFSELQASPPKADIYLAGSDQIWNCLFQNGKDPAFYLAFAPDDAVQASYAASFATEDIPDEWKEQVSIWLHGLDAISVRERSGVEILNRLGLNGQAVMDPVFLLERTQWEALALPMESKQPYLLVYDFDNNPEIARTAKELAEKNGWKILTLQKLPYADRCVENAGPREFLGLIRGAQYVLSNSFHATAFSLIFQRPFLVFDRSEHINTRMRDLMKTVGLDSRHSADEEIDWLLVADRIHKEVKASTAYLDKVISRAKEK